jgi:hypothetical protein
MVGIPSSQTPIDTIPYTIITDFESQEGILYSNRSKWKDNRPSLAEVGTVPA